MNKKRKIVKSRATEALNIQEAIKFLKNLKEDNKKLHLLFIIQLMLGLRIGDVLNLKFRDIDGVEELEIIEQKTGKQRKLIFQQRLADEIAEYLDGRYYKPNDYVFLNKRKTRTFSISYINQTLKKLFIKYDIKYTGNASSHTFRKTFATEIVKSYDYSEKGIFIVNKLFQHTTIQTTLRYLGIDKLELDNSYGLISLTTDDDLDNERVLHL